MASKLRSDVTIMFQDLGEMKAPFARIAIWQRF